MIFFSGPGRGGDYGRGGDGGVGNCSVWSAAELQAANATPARLSIDWNTIRENKEKYEELKWKGEGSYTVTNVLTLTVQKYVDSDVVVIDLALVQHNGFEIKQ